MPVRILRISSSVRKGGAGAHVLALHNGLNRTTDYQSFLLCPRDNSDVPRQVRYSFGRCSSYVNFFKTKLLGLDSYFDPLWSHRLAQLASQFDIIHLHHLQGYFFDLRSLASLRDRNVVLTLHDVWPLTGRCSVLTSCDRWQQACGACPRKDVYPSTFVDQSRFLHQRKKELFAGLRRLRIVALSRYAENLLQKSHLQDHPHVIIPPGIDLSIFRPIGEKSPQPVVGLVAAKPAEIQKGFETVKNLLSFLQQKKPGFTVHVVGQLNRNQQRYLKNYSFVNITPFIADEKSLTRLYNSFHVLVNFSHQETFGKTVVEAQACGVPVVARKIPAFTENVEYGALLDGDDPQTILNAIEHTLAQSWDREKMHRAMEKYSVENMVEKYGQLYRSLLQ